MIVRSACALTCMVFLAPALLADDADLDAYDLLEAAIEAETENASGLHRYVFFEDRVQEHVRGDGKVGRRRTEKHSVAWIDGMEIQEMLAINGKKPKKRDIEKRKRELERLLEKIADERADQEDRGLSIPGWHLYAGAGGREERQTFALTMLESDDYELVMLDDGQRLLARPTAEALRMAPRAAPALFEHRLWLDPETDVWVRWESRALRAGPVLAPGSTQTMTRKLVEDDIYLEDAIERTWLYLLSSRLDAPTSRVDVRIARYDFRRFYDVESAISYQETILDQ